MLRSLASLSRDCTIEYIEFPDRGGLAFCSLQEHRLQGFLSDAIFAVRLGSSHTALMHAEATAIELASLNLSDLERKCLRDCDVVLTPGKGVSEASRAMFGFEVEEWSPRLISHWPAVWLNCPPETEKTFGVHFDQSIVFAADLQRHKRPDVFLRGVVGFMRAELRYTGNAFVVGESADEQYASQLARLVPSALNERIRFKPRLEREKRELLLCGATVVFSGVWDACGVTAYEASLLGARVILNETNPTYGEDSSWVHGVNCLKFDGTSSGLTAALIRNFEGSDSLRVVQTSGTTPPWQVSLAKRPIWRPLVNEPLVSIVVPHFNLGRYLQATLENLLEQSYSNIEILIVDDASTDQTSSIIIDGIVRQENRRVKVVRLAANVGLAGARNVGVRHATGQYVLTLDADDLVHPSFLTVGVAALENNHDFDVVVTPAGYFDDDHSQELAGNPIEFSDYLVFSGEPVLAGLLENRFSTATALFRKSALDRFPYDESLSCYEDWALFMKMCDAGLRVIVATDIFFYYRKRAGSMVHAPRDALRMQIEYRDMLRSGAPDSVRQKSRHLLLGLASPAAGVLDSTGYDALLKKLANGAFGPRGEFDDQVAFASLKVSRWLERTAPGVLRSGLGAARWAWRVGGRLRGTRR